MAPWLVGGSTPFNIIELKYVIFNKYQFLLLSLYKIKRLRWGTVIQHYIGKLAINKWLYEIIAVEKWQANDILFGFIKQATVILGGVHKPSSESLFFLWFGFRSVTIYGPFRGATIPTTQHRNDFKSARRQWINADGLSIFSRVHHRRGDQETAWIVSEQST